MQTYWGDFHSQYHPTKTDRPWEVELREAFTAARAYLDFVSLIYYPAIFYRTPEGLFTESAGMKPEFAADWALLKALTREFHAPGRFVTFPGYEWTGDRTRWGDHNVFFTQDDPPLELPSHLDELYARLRPLGALAIPHHTGYLPGMRGKDWTHWDGDISPFAEIYSCHGSSEGCQTPFPLERNAAMGPRVSGGTLQDGWARGCRVGVCASTDQTGFAGRWGWGLIAAQATALTREALWEAFHARRVYGVTGDRILLDYTLNDAPMGAQIAARGPATLRGAITGAGALDRVEVLKDNRVVFTHCHQDTWEPPAAGTARAKVAFEFGWGPARLSGLPVEPRHWPGRLRTPGGAIHAAEGRFTCRGNHVTRVSEGEYHFQVTCEPRETYAPGAASQQGIVFEIEAPLDAPLTLEVEGGTMTFTLAEALRTERVLALVEESRQQVEAHFRLDAGTLETGEDTAYHNAWKVLRHRAAPVDGYTARLEWTDLPAPGPHWYYLRVSQLNGHYAWSSPIWVDATG